jgi:hypothetical protein
MPERAGIVASRFVRNTALAENTMQLSAAQKVTKYAAAG